MLCITEHSLWSSWSFMGGFTLQSYFTLQRFKFFIFFLRFQHGNEKYFHSKNTRQDNLERRSTSEKGFLRTWVNNCLNSTTCCRDFRSILTWERLHQVSGLHSHNATPQGSPLDWRYRQNKGILLWSSADTVSSKTQVGFKMNWTASSGRSTNT